MPIARKPAVSSENPQIPPRARFGFLIRIDPSFHSRKLGVFIEPQYFTFSIWKDTSVDSQYDDLLRIRSVAVLNSMGTVHR